MLVIHTVHRSNWNDMSLRREGCNAHEGHRTSQTEVGSSNNELPPIGSVKRQAICMVCLSVLVLVIVYFTALSKS
jgi:hypothetical protein